MNVEPVRRRQKKQLISFTDAAIAQIRQILTLSDEKVLGLAIGIKKGGCAGFEYVMKKKTAENSQDEHIFVDGMNIYVEQSAILYLVGMTIDYQKTDTFEKFIFENPNQTDACGCGESVTLKQSSL